MKKEQLVAYVLRMLHRDYAFRVCQEEEPILALKLYLAMEELETQAQRDAFCRQWGKVSLN